MSKELYNWYKSHGICTKCGQNDAYEGHFKCLQCMMDEREYRKNWRLKNAEKQHILDTDGECVTGIFVLDVQTGEVSRYQ